MERFCLDLDVSKLVFKIVHQWTRNLLYYSVSVQLGHQCVLFSVNRIQEKIKLLNLVVLEIA